MVSFRRATKRDEAPPQPLGALLFFSLSLFSLTDKVVGKKDKSFTNSVAFLKKILDNPLRERPSRVDVSNELRAGYLHDFERLTDLPCEVIMPPEASSSRSGFASIPPFPEGRPYEADSRCPQRSSTRWPLLIGGDRRRFSFYEWSNSARTGDWRDDWSRYHGPNGAGAP